MISRKAKMLTKYPKKCCWIVWVKYIGSPFPKKIISQLQPWNRIHSSNIFLNARLCFDDKHYRLKFNFEKIVFRRNTSQTLPCPFWISGFQYLHCSRWFVFMCNGNFLDFLRPSKPKYWGGAVETFFFFSLVNPIRA